MPKIIIIINKKNQEKIIIFIIYQMNDNEMKLTNLLKCCQFICIYNSHMEKYNILGVVEKFFKKFSKLFHSHHHYSNFVDDNNFRSTVSGFCLFIQKSNKISSWHFKQTTNLKLNQQKIYLNLLVTCEWHLSKERGKNAK